MNLVEALENEPERSCTYKELKNRLTDEENQALDFALRNPTKAIREIHDILGKAGYSIGRETLSKHRKGICAICASA